ncbi:DNA polymerase III, delta subunit [Devosia enhydra]|uniref:DNA-directed DNA polymerase n=1 Tax=Devosia enhydra TaxID=665118 RepID=A0A1K2HYX7_9HYPH|nr:DNA polymerase III subunit delta [Devosia enhydra]SFZ85082.1 DNA polymerase III, delta subunit [Devosia enhydra]
MTALKAHEVERYIIRPDIRVGVYLAYGPDAGLVNEVATRLVATLAGEGSDQAEIVTLDQAVLDGDAQRLAVEARSTSLFGERRVLHLRSPGKGTVLALAELIDDLAVPIIIEAGNLAAKDPLRAFAEAQKLGRALPCYADSDEAVARLISDTFSKAGIRADADAMAAIRDSLGNDRAVTRAELEKLVLFAGPGGTVTRDDVLALCADNAALMLDAILDNAGSGHAENMERALNRAIAAKVDPQQILTMALNHFTTLRRWRLAVDGGQPARAVLDSARPRPHFSRRAAFERQLRSWDEERLASATDRVLTGINESRRNAPLSEAIARRTFLALCYMGSAA